ncbi:unnamed protein product [Ectocarpus sp. CCAP 1310/34]|nr:unnamed protein product [Ectocarpus sp. CCAP 1310/34]
MRQARIPSIIYNKVGGGAPGDDPGYFGVPPGASRAVTAARLCIVLSIVIHTISLFVEGWYWPWQRNAAFGVFAVGGLVLCIYDQYMYAIGGIGFAVCALFDLFAVLRWITDDENIVDGDGSFDGSSEGTTALWYALPPFFGAIAMGLGAIFSFTAVFLWEDGDGTAVPHESKTVELGLAPLAARPGTPPRAYYPQSPHPV